LEEYRGRIVAIYLLVFLILGGLIFTSPEITPDGTSTLEEVESYEGSLGVEKEYDVYSPTSEIVLFNDTPSSTSSSWVFSFLWGIPEIQESSERFTVGMKPNILIGENAAMSCSAVVNVPVQSIDALTYSSYLSVHSGEIKARLGASTFNLDEDLDFSHELTLGTGESTKIVLDEILEDMQAATDSLIVQTQFYLEVVFISNARVDIHYMVANASTTENVMPVTINPQSPDGTSLSESQYQHQISDCTAISVSSLNSNQTFMLYFWTGKDQIFLPSDNYTCYAGWKDNLGDGKPPFYGGEIRAFSINVENGESTVCAVRLPCIKLYIRVSPSVPTLSLRISTSSEEQYDVDIHGGPNDALVFVPTEDSDSWLSIRSRVVSREYRNWPEIPRVSGEFSIYSIIRAILSVSGTTFFGVVITPLEIYTIVAAVVVAILVTPKMYEFVRRIGIKNLLTQPTTIPFLLLTTSVVLPWTVFQTSSGYHISKQLTWIYIHNIPLSSFLLTAKGFDSYFMPEICMIHYPSWSPLWGNAFRDIGFSVILFWIPWMYIANKIRHQKADQLGLTKVWVFLLPPIAILLVGLFNPWLYCGFLSFGAVLAIVAQIAYLVIHIIHCHKPEWIASFKL